MAPQEGLEPPHPAPEAGALSAELLGHSNGIIFHASGPFKPLDLYNESVGQRSAAEKLIATNRRAYHDYFVEETLEAGLVLTGSEIKSIRDGRVNLRDGYVEVRDGEAWLVNVHIASYPQAGKAFGHEPTRPRKLLLHRREIAYLAGKIQQKGYTAVPLRLYLKNGRAKVEVGIVRGKKQYDKRAAIAERDARREVERALSGRY